MTRDDIIRMTQEACSQAPRGDWNSTAWVLSDEALELFADLIKQQLIAEGYRKCAEGQRTTQFCKQVEAAVATEREACAQVCDNIWATSAKGFGDGADRCGDAIRARNEKLTTGD